MNDQREQQRKRQSPTFDQGCSVIAMGVALPSAPNAGDHPPLQSGEAR
jgi:hypothetical protein